MIYCKVVPGALFLSQFYYFYLNINYWDIKLYTQISTFCATFLARYS